MIALLIVSLIWGFSFGIIKDTLSEIDPSFVSFARLLIPFFIFLPFLRLKKIPRHLWIRLVLIGAVQYGLMYLTYIRSFQYLKAFEVALFTIFTPLYITLFSDLLKKKFSPITFGAVLVAVFGTGVIQFGKPLESAWLGGFILVQLSNICFAAGQIKYKRILEPLPEIQDINIFALLYFGAAITTGIAVLIFTDLGSLVINHRSSLSILYLGVVASGLGFFLWNYGARKVNTGTLAIFNDLKIPLAILISILIFNESTDLTRLVIGCVIIITALWMNDQIVKSKSRFSQI